MIKNVICALLLAGIIGFAGALQCAAVGSERDPRYWNVPAAREGSPAEDKSADRGDFGDGSPDEMSIKQPPNKRHFPIHKAQPKPQPTPAFQAGPKPTGTPTPPVTRPS